MHIFLVFFFLPLEYHIPYYTHQLSETMDNLTSILDSPDAPPSTSMLHAASRHKDVLSDYRRDFSRLRGNVELALQRNNLLGSIRQDINAYKSSLPPQTDALLAERNRIDSSNRMTDDILNQAYATREDFAQQRTMLAGVNSRIGGVLSEWTEVSLLLSHSNLYRISRGKGARSHRNGTINFQIKMSNQNFGTSYPYLHSVYRSGKLTPGPSEYRTDRIS